MNSTKTDRIIKSFAITGYISTPVWKPNGKMRTLKEQRDKILWKMK